MQILHRIEEGGTAPCPIAVIQYENRVNSAEAIGAASSRQSSSRVACLGLASF